MLVTAKLPCRPLYHAHQIKAWEGRWFDSGNSSFGLMQQAALLMSEHIKTLIDAHSLIAPTILVWCGTGNNGGDGYLIAHYLKQHGFNVAIYAPKPPTSIDAKSAKTKATLTIIEHLDNHTLIDALGALPNVHIDALFGSGLDREVSLDYQYLFKTFNQKTGLKIAIDIPSGLHPDTGCPLPVAIQADYTLCVMGLKLGLYINKGRHYAGKVIEIPLIPSDDKLIPFAHLNTHLPTLPPKIAYAHKGDFGHVLVIGGHATMGGAVIMSAEAAMASGAGKVTVMCHKSHHHAILSRSPNIMVKDIEDCHQADFLTYLEQIDSVAFGMGLGRDTWAQAVFERLFEVLERTALPVVIDADALYWLAHSNKAPLPSTWVCTPHHAEAARLLSVSTTTIGGDVTAAIFKLHRHYGANWVLKGAGSLSLEPNNTHQPTLYVCAFGNQGMATAGMGDVLSGVIATLIHLNLSLADCVALHALAGDHLAKQGMYGINAHQMPDAIRYIINS